MGESGGDRRPDRTSGSGGISITGASRQHAQAGFFDRPWLVLGAVAAGIAIGVGVMVATDATHLGRATPARTAAAAAPTATSDGIDVDVRPEAAVDTTTPPK